MWEVFFLVCKFLKYRMGKVKIYSVFFSLECFYLCGEGYNIEKIFEDVLLLYRY